MTSNQSLDFLDIERAGYVPGGVWQRHAEIDRFPSGNHHGTRHSADTVDSRANILFSCDEYTITAGNVAIDDNGGAFYTFTTDEAGTGYESMGNADT